MTHETGEIGFFATTQPLVFVRLITTQSALASYLETDKPRIRAVQVDSANLSEFALVVTRNHCAMLTVNSGELEVL